MAVAVTTPTKAQKLETSPRNHNNKNNINTTIITTNKAIISESNSTTGRTASMKVFES
ncbi:hypothetical protein E4U34_007577 [Claviceps purpurea]|nr:hypothetical protein E4U34_007577 [Claviceps purpurea]KAG6256852.1 hypothetical protein E4U23_000397 [Claviceps purpurea]